MHQKEPVLSGRNKERKSNDCYPRGHMMAVSDLDTARHGNGPFVRSSVHRGRA